MSDASLIGLEDALVIFGIMFIVVMVVVIVGSVAICWRVAEIIREWREKRRKREEEAISFEI